MTAMKMKQLYIIVSIVCVFIQKVKVVVIIDSENKMASDTEIVPADALFEVAKLFQITNPGNSPSNTQKRTASSPSISRQTASSKFI